MILLGLIRIWSQQVGIDLPSVDDHPTQAMLDHVDENVMPNLSILSKEKMPSAGND